MARPTKVSVAADPLDALTSEVMVLPGDPRNEDAGVATGIPWCGSPMPSGPVLADNLVTMLAQTARQGAAVAC
jgi:hypothetical protein